MVVVSTQSPGGGWKETLPLRLVSAGLAACAADLLTFPLDTAKVRLQVQGEGIFARTAREKGHVHKYRGLFGTLYRVRKDEGFRALYSGLSAGLQRQMCFSSIRIGFYDDVKRALQRLLNGSDSSVGVRILAGLSTGALSVTVAQPTDVVKVRMQAQGITGVRRYDGALQAYSMIWSQEGVKGLWKGSIPNATRNSITNASELVSYDLMKAAILRRGLMSDNFPCHILCGFGAGFFATLFASPVDVVKTRYMNSQPGQYPGALHCALHMLKQNGPGAFYKGCVPSFVRFGVWNMLMFAMYEQLKRLLSGQYQLPWRNVYCENTGNRLTAIPPTKP